MAVCRMIAAYPKVFAVPIVVYALSIQKMSELVDTREIPDLQFGFSPNEVQKLMNDQWGPEGCQAYATVAMMDLFPQCSLLKRQLPPSKAATKTDGEPSFKKPHLPVVDRCLKRTPPVCHCGRRSRRLTVQAVGPNTGRHFLACANGNRRSGGCKFFVWEEESERRQQEQRQRSWSVFVPEERNREEVGDDNDGDSKQGSEVTTSTVIGKHASAQKSKISSNSRVQYFGNVPMRL